MTFDSLKGNWVCAVSRWLPVPLIIGPVRSLLGGAGGSLLEHNSPQGFFTETKLSMPFFQRASPPANRLQIFCGNNRSQTGVCLRMYHMHAHKEAHTDINIQKHILRGRANGHIYRCHTCTCSHTTSPPHTHTYACWCSQT